MHGLSAVMGSCMGSVRFPAAGRTAHTATSDAAAVAEAHVRQTRHGRSGGKGGGGCRRRSGTMWRHHRSVCSGSRSCVARAACVGGATGGMEAKLAPSQSDWNSISPSAFQTTKCTRTRVAFLIDFH